MNPKYTRYVSFCIKKINIHMLGLVKLNSWNIGIDFLKNQIIIKVPTFWMFVCWKKHESKEIAHKWMKYFNQYHKRGQK